VTLGLPIFETKVPIR